MSAEPEPTADIPHSAPVRVEPATAAAVARAAAVVQAGGLVAFPTETVYGLGADAGNGRAVAAIYEAKGRPQFNPLIVHVADMAMAERVAVLDGRAHELAAHYWPGPLTLILPRSDGASVSDLATAGLSSIAVRMPSHPVARALIRAAGRPIAAPSANRSGRVSPTSAQHVAEELGGRVDMILAAGKSAIGLESTILDLTGPTPALLRPGAVTQADIEAVLGPIALAAGDPDKPNAPGQLRRHYAPSTALRLDAPAPEQGEALLAFGPAPFASRAVASLNLSANGDLEEAAANLFAMLRALDAGGHARIAVMPIPETGLGAAINDRLRRAAAPKGSGDV